MKTMTRAQAQEEGYVIDDCAAGSPIGYKGARFRPDADLVRVLSEQEERLAEALKPFARIGIPEDYTEYHMETFVQCDDVRRARRALADLGVDLEQDLQPAGLKARP